MYVLYKLLFLFLQFLGDPTVCGPFSNSEIFKDSGNHFFCLVEPELQLMTPFIKNFSIWQTYTYGKSEKMKEQAIK